MTGPYDSAYSGSSGLLWQSSPDYSALPEEVFRPEECSHEHPPATIFEIPAPTSANPRSGNAVVEMPAPEFCAV
jgi:hypothetical protein